MKTTRQLATPGSCLAARFPTQSGCATSRESHQPSDMSYGKGLAFPRKSVGSRRRPRGRKRSWRVGHSCKVHRPGAIRTVEKGALNLPTKLPPLGWICT
jgi:hypothetical protein